MLAFSVKNSKNQSTCKTTEVPNDANNSNENRNKSCRDDDGTSVNTMNTKLPAKLNRRSDRGDGLTYHINSLSYISCCKRNESSLSYEKSYRKKRCNPINDE